ncbi:PEP-CTERM sorting domain-containing protein [Massilia sp. S19_KUP03_FR1]|uniref:PEP-CTERM sorting domain-containing protein n=1 Tax=Massilia sp. S19_KUP03_FR1 TaxID=3025503 RepID=UPI002FCCFDEE
MSTRHLIAAAALLATTFAAQADVVTLSSSSTPSANMPIGDFASSLSGASLAEQLAASNSSVQLYLVRGVEGLYMVASRRINAAVDAELDDVPLPGLGDAAPDVLPDTPIPTGTVPSANLDADPVVSAAEVPEPSSIALLLAGMLGAVGFTRGRKQG